MRYREIFEASAAHIPAQYMIDDATDLALNTEGQWSKSPYLGAVAASNRKGYLAQINIPQEIWRQLIQQNPHKWSDKLPPAYFNEQGQSRPPIRVAFADPRQAAWFMQEVLYGGDAKDLIEDYLEQYLGGPGDLWKDLLSKVPTFDGEPLTSADEKDYFADPEVFRQRREERRKAAQDAKTAATNASNYHPEMSRKIKRELVNFFLKNSQLAKRRFGQKFKTRQELEQAVDHVVDQKGVDYFVTAPGSVKLKDIASLPMK